MVTFELNRGSDLRAVMTLKDGAAAVDLTGMTPTIVEVLPPSLAPDMQFTIPAPLAGQMLLVCPWSDAWPVGVGALVRVRLRIEEMPDAFPMIQVVLK